MSASMEPTWLAVLAEAGATVCAPDPLASWSGSARTGSAGEVTVLLAVGEVAQRYVVSGERVAVHGAELDGGARRALTDGQALRLAEHTRALSRSLGAPVQLSIEGVGRAVHVVGAERTSEPAPTGARMRVEVGEAVTPLGWSLRAAVEGPGLAWLPGGRIGRRAVADAEDSLWLLLPVVVLRTVLGRPTSLPAPSDAPLDEVLREDQRWLAPVHQGALARAHALVVARLQHHARRVGFAHWSPVHDRVDDALEALRQAVLAAPRLREVLARPDAVVDDLRGTADGTRALEAYRLAGGLVDDALLQALRSPPAAPFDPAQALLERVRGTLLQPRVMTLLWLLARLGDEQDRLAALQAEATLRVRGHLREVGGRLVAAGLLDEIDEVEWLTLAECVDWLDGAPPVDLRATIALRRARAEADGPLAGSWSWQGPLHVVGD